MIRYSQFGLFIYWNKTANKRKYNCQIIVLYLRQIMYAKYDQAIFAMAILLLLLRKLFKL